MSDAWSSGFIVATGAVTAAGLELAAWTAYRRRHRRQHPTVEPVPWREMQHHQR